HLINAVQPTANRLLKGVHNVINRIWADLLQLGELNGPDLPERDRRILRCVRSFHVYSKSHLKSTYTAHACSDACCPCCTWFAPRTTFPSLKIRMTRPGSGKWQEKSRTVMWCAAKLSGVLL